jgi:hypothetical protein
VVYDPAEDRTGNYVPTDLPQRYDAFIFIATTEALHPLQIGARSDKSPALHPWGL